MKTPPNPNAIIAALLDVATAAYALNHSSVRHPNGAYLTTGEDIDALREKLALLEALPQMAENEHFTGPRRARGWLASFLVGEVALNFDDKQLAELKNALNQARSTPLLVAEFEHSMREYQDAELLRNLHAIVSEPGVSCVSIYGREERTRIEIIPESDNGERAREYFSTSFHQAIRAATDGEFPEEPEPEECKFCGITTTSPCDTPPADTCEKALAALDPQGGDVIPLMEPRGYRGMASIHPVIQVDNTHQQYAALAPVAAAVEGSKRTQMNALLVEVKETFGVPEAKRIIVSIGHSERKMADIPDNRVQAVIDAARDKLREKARQEFQAQAAAVAIAPDVPNPREVTVYDHFDVPDDPESEDGKATIAAMNHYVATGELPKPTLHETLHKAGEVLGNQDPIVEPKADDQVQGQGGEFDGGGASGDWTQ